MTSYSLISTSLASAALFAPDANEVLKPMITDPDAAARSISVSVISPELKVELLPELHFLVIVLVIPILLQHCLEHQL